MDGFFLHDIVRTRAIFSWLVRYNSCITLKVIQYYINKNHSRYIHLMSNLRPIHFHTKRLYVHMFDTPLSMAENLSSANHFRNFPRQKKVISLWSKMQILPFYFVGQAFAWSDIWEIVSFSPLCRGYRRVRLATHLRTLYFRRFSPLRDVIWRQPDQVNTGCLSKYIKYILDATFSRWLTFLTKIYQYFW